MAVCQDCLKDCDIKNIDVGIGSYEFWGHMSVDIHWVPVSSCCEGIAFESIDEDGMLVSEITDVNVDDDIDVGDE